MKKILSCMAIMLFAVSVPRALEYYETPLYRLNASFDSILGNKLSESERELRIAGTVELANMLAADLRNFAMENAAPDGMPKLCVSIGVSEKEARDCFMSFTYRRDSVVEIGKKLDETLAAIPAMTASAAKREAWRTNLMGTKHILAAHLSAVDEQIRRLRPAAPPWY